MPKGMYPRKPADYQGAKPTLADIGKRKRPKLATETRTYLVDESDLSEWLTDGPAFYVQEIMIKGTKIEFTMTTAKQAEQPQIRQEESVRTPEWSSPVLEDEPDPGFEVAVGKADADPFIATSAEVATKKRLKSVRELRLEAQRTGTPEPKVHITHLTEDETDPVPSALPR